MIAATVEELTPLIGTRPACRALGASPATIYRRRRPPPPRPPRPGRRRLGRCAEPERQQVLEVLHSERFVDVSPEETYATLLDDGTYLCSTRTMYRILAANHGGVRERRDQLTHPAYAKPELLAERPNELWSWDVSKLKGPAKWTWFYLYVILDVFSRYVVGWTVAYRENAQLATALIEQAAEQQQITPKILTLHADRGARSAPSRSASSRRPRDHQDPQPAVHLERQPLLGVELQDAEVPARVPRPVRHRSSTPALTAASSSTGTTTPHRHSGIGLMTPCRRPPRPRRAAHAARAHVRDQHPGTVRPQAASAAGPADRRVDQQAEGGRRRSLISNAKRLTELDRLRLA